MLLTFGLFISICKNLKKKAALRTSFYYNNLMYGLMSNLTAILGNDTWENIVNAHLLTPLGRPHHDSLKLESVNQRPCFA